MGARDSLSLSLSLYIYIFLSCSNLKALSLGFKSSSTFLLRDTGGALCSVVFEVVEVISKLVRIRKVGLIVSSGGKIGVWSQHTTSLSLSLSLSLSVSLYIYTSAR